MKVTNVRPWIIEVDWDNRPGSKKQRDPVKRRLVFVQVDTDEGITGWGEVTTYPGPVANSAIAAFIREVGQSITGDDATQIEAIWQKIFRSMTYLGTRGATTACISAIDIALWDIRGKSLNQPIYKLLGGEVRDRIALYTHPPEPRSVEQAIADAKEILASGHRAFKFDPMRSNGGRGTRYMDGEIDPDAEQQAYAIVEAVREAIGPKPEILVDAHGCYNVPTAVRLANTMAQWNIHWFEEPVPPESWKALKQVKEQSRARICVGERLHTRFEFLPIFENGLADFVMPDVTWTGGISELKKISTMAEAYYIPMSPHDASGPVNVVAGSHVMMTVPNFYKLETMRYDLSGYNAFIDHPLDIRNGDLYLSPDRPGLGINLDPGFLKAHEVKTGRTGK